ncbi:probable RNA polymerase II nuclear localization protein SLC7A6OS [Anopheles bellator]|uniref:probable RNA polymerase II nuclear localization protein SLC7A6OS n=1 Tax=Anopheles bellator TaxID=139047 RepID=UPI002649F1D7|nr:probable RNA polymerase II nuclear localization protein SLC7A6OS [Anopheles bellator]
MTTVIRLKRRVDEDPLNAFVLNCKRQRVAGTAAADESNANADESSTILKFAGTFTQADGITSHLQSIHKDQAKDAVSRVHRPNIKSRNRLAAKQHAQNDRFRIVNCTRSLTDQTEAVADGGGSIPSLTTIVDVERDGATASVPSALPSLDPMTSVAPQPNAAQYQQQQQQSAAVENFSYENGVHYVYDLYVADTSQNAGHSAYFTDNLDDLSVMVCEDPLYACHRGGLDSDDSSDTDSDDSNAESHWRNEYPDEDDDARLDGGSIGEDDMRRAVEELDLEGERELSSDDDDDGFVYPKDDGGVLYTDEEEDSQSDTEIDREDVRRYGTAYARYKARVLRTMEGRDEESSSTSSEENFDLYD